MTPLNLLGIGLGHSPVLNVSTTERTENVSHSSGQYFSYAPFKDAHGLSSKGDSTSITVVNDNSDDIIPLNV